MDFYGTIHSRCILTFNKPPWNWHLPRIRLGPTGTFDSPADGEIITLPKETLAASFVPHPQSQIMSLQKLYVHFFLSNSSQHFFVGTCHDTGFSFTINI